MDITIILCTYNRCEDLAGSLETIVASEMPNSFKWEVLVVDNNSADQTREVVESFCQRYPARFRYLLEPEAGKSYALNAGIANARGEVLVFADDDASMHPECLRHLAAALQDSEWAGVGGRILPAQTFTPPHWMSDDLSKGGGILCAYFDLGDKAGELDRPPYGANMAYRKSVFAKYGGFRTDLGPRPNSQIRNEDTEFGRRLLAAGERIKYEPSAVVYHPVPLERMTRKYFLAWWFDYRRALIIERGNRPDIFGIPYDYFSFLRCVLGMPFTTLRWIFTISSAKRFWYKCQVWQAAGQIVELCDRNRPRSKKNTPMLQKK